MYRERETERERERERERESESERVILVAKLFSINVVTIYMPLLLYLNLSFLM